MSKNINIISEDVCTGCGACNNCCPVDAIEMLEVYLSCHDLFETYELFLCSQG